MKTLLPAFLATALAGVACAVATDAPGLLAAGQTGASTRDGSPEGRAIAFLSREVPRWPVENHCYSCHNNGDAARALYTAVQLDYPVEPDALRDTSAWLQSPGEWDGNATDQEFSDKALARIQFAGALVHAMDAGVTDDREPLIRAGAGWWPRIRSRMDPGSSTREGASAPQPRMEHTSRPRPPGECW